MVKIVAIVGLVLVVLGIGIYKFKSAPGVLAPTPIPKLPTVNPTASSSASPTARPTTSPQKVSPTVTNIINVLSLSYFPLDQSGQNLDQAVTKYPSSLSEIRQKVKTINEQLMSYLSKGTRYHGYKDGAILPSIEFKMVDAKEFLEALPPSNFGNPVQPDYRSILNRVNICDYVDNKNISQVWLWGYHTDKIAPVESDMSMGTNSRGLWNHDTYGDISNSYQIDDLPVCQKTYTLYNYNYQRTVAEAMHDHMHQLENLYSFADATLWNNFVNPYGQDGVNHCGDTHHPVNSRTDYDYQNQTSVQSDCTNWQPDGGGSVESVNCSNWGRCIDDGGVSWYIWWMQNIPGQNNGLTYKGKALRNWWDLYLNFDQAFATGKRLTQN